MTAPDDFLAMRRGVHDLNVWLHRQGFDPTMAIAVLTAVLSEYAVAYNYKLVTIAEQLVLCGADFHDEWSKKPPFGWTHGDVDAA